MTSVPEKMSRKPALETIILCVRRERDTFASSTCFDERVYLPAAANFFRRAILEIRWSTGQLGEDAAVCRRVRRVVVGVCHRESDGIWGDPSPSGV